MNFQFYVEKLIHSEDYKNFVKENPEAYFCSGFFIIDREEADNKQHFDFDNNGELVSFQIEDKCKLVPVDMADKQKLERVNLDLDFDFEAMEKLIEARMEEEKIKNKIQKFLFSLQKKDGKTLLLGTVFISGLGLLRVEIDIGEKKILEFEKKSFFDMLKIKKGKAEKKEEKKN